MQWKKEESDKKLYKYSAACFFMKQNNMYVTTSRCDDYPTSMNSKEAIKEVQSAAYQISAGTNCFSDLLNTFTYKKVSKIIA